MNWNKVGRVLCNILCILTLAEAFYHIGYYCGWSGFTHGLSDSSIICNSIIAACYWLTKANRHAEKE